nr:unnamed protein product [Callosobruchus analis]
MKISRKQRYKLAVLVLRCYKPSLSERINIDSILGEAELPEKVCSTLREGFVSELKEEAKVELMSTYLPPENVKAFVPITINPEVKVAIQENTLKRNNPRPQGTSTKDFHFEWLFGTKLENTIQVAKKLEKLGEQLKVKKNKPPRTTLASI